MKKILIINVNWLGDVLFSTPFIRAVRHHFGESHIACLAVPRVRPILELNPAIDEIIVYDERGLHASLMGKIRLIRLLRSKRFDTVFILHRSFTRALIAFLSGIKIRVGYNTKKRGFLLTHAINPPSGEIHKVDYFLNMAQGFGIEPNSKNYEFFISNRDRRSVENILAAEGIGRDERLVVINAGGNWDPKRWPADNFARLADSLMKELSVRVVLSGAGKDRGLAGKIVSSMKGKPAILCGRTSIKELGALMERADLVISNDSGPMHIAVSMKTPVLSLFGPTSADLTGPYGTGDYTVLRKDIGCAVPCYDYNCRNNRCMKAITPEEVFKKAREMLSSKVFGGVRIS